MSKIYTITEVVNTIVRHCSGLFSFVWVKGEVSNCSYSSSGTLYFSLKENNILLDCVWFESKQKDEIHFDVLTGEVKETPTICVSKTIKNGDYLYVAGSLAIYKERSKYQLYVELAEYIGQGKYTTEFQEKKYALEAECLFHPRYKQKIPINPYQIALITSKEGAALQDFLHVTIDRGLGGVFLLHNTLMQGVSAVQEICHAIEMANQSNAEGIVLIRGGGAKEE
ncbi:MAG: exodeoxyribonuclease VII large subunit, partial [Desulfovibrionaceae bacterium]|nr:exodeoxyribonuclease VII large subunit [Desulfovibrionaceae bacterium]